ncbi:MAG: hypothetical protein AAF618_06035 [Pseudomonadota bacterium]
MDDKIKTSAEALEADAGLRLKDVRESGTPPATTSDLPPKARAKPVAQKSAAEWAYERLILYIQNFEKLLNSEEEVAVGFAGDETGVMRIDGMGYFDPDIITFYGSDPTGAKTQLVQHVSQLSVMLRALPKHVDHVEPRRIGFRLAQELEEGP